MIKKSLKIQKVLFSNSQLRTSTVISVVVLRSYRMIRISQSSASAVNLVPFPAP